MAGVPRGQVSKSSEIQGKLPFTSRRLWYSRIATFRTRANIGMFRHWNYRSAKRTSDTNLLALWRTPA